MDIKVRLKINEQEIHGEITSVTILKNGLTELNILFPSFTNRISDFWNGNSITHVMPDTCNLNITTKIDNIKDILNSL